MTDEASPTEDLLTSIRKEAQSAFECFVGPQPRPDAARRYVTRILNAIDIHRSLNPEEPAVRVADHVDVSVKLAPGPADLRGKIVADVHDKRWPFAERHLPSPSARVVSVLADEAIKKGTDLARRGRAAISKMLEAGENAAYADAMARIAIIEPFFNDVRNQLKRSFENPPQTRDFSRDLAYLDQAEAHADEGTLGEAAARSILAIALNFGKRVEELRGKVEEGDKKLRARASALADLLGFVAIIYTRSDLPPRVREAFVNHWRIENARKIAREDGVESMPYEAPPELSIPKPFGPADARAIVLDELNGLGERLAKSSTYSPTIVGRMIIDYAAAHAASEPGAIK